MNSCGSVFGVLTRLVILNIAGPTVAIALRKFGASVGAGAIGEKQDTLPNGRGPTFHPSAFITMGAPHVSSVEETLFLPGIKAYSETSSLFGQRDTLITDQLTVGETVTLVCTFGDAFRVDGLRVGSSNEHSGYSVTLEDCKIQEQSIQEQIGIFSAVESEDGGAYGPA